MRFKWISNCGSTYENNSQILNYGRNWISTGDVPIYLYWGYLEKSMNPKKWNAQTAQKVMKVKRNSTNFKVIWTVQVTCFFLLFTILMIASAMSVKNARLLVCSSYVSTLLGLFRPDLAWLWMALWWYCRHLKTPLSFGAPPQKTTGFPYFSWTIRSRALKFFERSFLLSLYACHTFF
jgi:hypothetical protein